MLCRLSYVGIFTEHRNIHGAGNGARTRDPELGRLALYQLSYSRFMMPRSSVLGGEGRIRTSEGVRRQIYSLLPLAAREPLPPAPATFRHASADGENRTRNLLITSQLLYL